MEMGSVCCIVCFNHVVTTFSPSSIVNNTSGSLSVRAGVMSETEVAAPIGLGTVMFIMTVRSLQTSSFSYSKIIFM